MLGRFEVVSAEGTPVAFRSRKVGSLLALLALNSGRELANSTIQDLLWPESDSDKQAQSLRRAVADLRDALPFGNDGRTVARMDHGRTSLTADCITTDTGRFLELLKHADRDDFSIRAAEALALYAGPLLAPFDDEWVFAYQRQYEETYCRGVEALCHKLVQEGESREAARIGGEAIIVAREREEPYIATIRAYAAMGNRSMALQQFEALELMLDDTFGQSPSEAALAALDGDLVSAPAKAATVPSVGATVSADPVGGGGLELESRYYIMRKSDQQIYRALEAREPVVLVFGPRQVGKTSLLARSAAQLRAEGAVVAVTDFQSFGKSEVQRSTTLYRSLIHSLATQLGLDYEPAWNEWVGANTNLDAQVDKVLRQVTGNICWAMDEVDRLFPTDYGDDFFGLVRSWHNRRALDPSGPWARLSILISYATEAHLFIKDLNQSPFNVGVRINLCDFTAEQVQELGDRHGSQVAQHAHLVYSLTHGHPYLARRAFGYLQAGNSATDLTREAPLDAGPFGDHLRRVQEMIRLDSETLAEATTILKSGKPSNVQALSRLVSAGLVTASGNQATMRVPIYDQYLNVSLT